MSSSTEMKARFDRVKSNFDEELKKDIPSNVCVFQVPRSLSSVKPEAYTPQLVGLGPYHHLQPQLTDMERIKLDVVKKLQKKFPHLSLDDLTSKLSELNRYVRLYYHKFLDMDEGMLSWIMTVDALFLFYLLCQHGADKLTPGLELSPYLTDIADQAGKKLAEDAILRDVMMLENQIPILFLKNMLTVGCAPLEFTEQRTILEENFPRMLEGFCLALSPLREAIEYPRVKASKRAHLLDLLYSMVVERKGEFENPMPDYIIPIKEEHKIDIPDLSKGYQNRMSVSGGVQTAMAIHQIGQDMVDVGSKLRRDWEALGKEAAPAEEKALIPTASSLAKAGVRFRGTRFIQEISFDKRTLTFQLPVFKLCVNSEVVIRNLVAYEAMATSGPLVFARFMELMNGLIDTPDDVKLLKQDRIITGHLKDDEVTHLFNGMSDSIEVNGNFELDETIEDVNEFYKAALNIKARNMIDRYVYRAWKFLAMIATVLFFLLTALQTFCSAYGCSGLVNKSN